jgi:hypothetical protein
MDYSDSHNEGHTNDYGSARKHNHLTPELLMFFGRLEAKMDAFTEWAKEHEEAAEKIRDRISTLERENARNIGIAAGISFVVSTIAGILSYTLALGGPS